ncbi:MAG: hypothetical protein E5X94_07465, partial [Mesorhizobium sp.]
MRGRNPPGDFKIAPRPLLLRPRLRSLAVLAKEAAHFRGSAGPGAFSVFRPQAGFSQRHLASMARIVMKFGGTSVADIARIRN